MSVSSELHMYQYQSDLINLCYRGQSYNINSSARIKSTMQNNCIVSVNVIRYIQAEKRLVVAKHG